MFDTDHDDYFPRQPYQLGLPGIDCLLLPPDEALTDAVHYHWSLSVTDAHVALPVVPDNAVDLVLCPAARDYAELYFPVERRFEIPLEGPVCYVGTCLRLDRAARLLGHPLEELRRLAPGIETREALGLGPLIERLGQHGADAPDALAAALDVFLGHRRASDTDDASRAEERERRLFDPFLDAWTSPRIGDVASRTGLSERQLRRETRRLFGLGPKTLQRVVRLQRALAELIAGEPSRADFHDDAHRIHELRALSGWTPGEIRRMAERYNTARGRQGTLLSRTPRQERRR